VQCLVCGSRLSPLFRSRDFLRSGDPTTYTVGWCSRCRYGRVDGRFDPASVARFYDVPYYTHQEGSPAEAARGFWARARAHLAWRADAGVDLLPDEGVGKSLLDIGCGAGGNLSRFSAGGFEVTGVEPDEAARRVASRYGPVYAGTAELLPQEVRLRAYDTVLLSHVLEHCIDPKVALLNARDLLARGGRLIIEVPNNAAAGFGSYRECWPWTDVPRHLHFFTRQSLHELLTRCGFDVERTLYVGYCRQFEPDWISKQQRISVLLRQRRSMSAVESWQLLLRTMFRSRDAKYVSLRVHASVA
jgi:SAM-dependent methyltransferase